MGPKFFFNNAARNGYLYSWSSQDDEYPARNVIDPQRPKHWITGKTQNPEVLIGSFGYLQPIDTIIFFTHDFKEGDVLTLRLADNINFIGQDIFNIPVTAAPLIFTLPEKKSYLWYSLCIQKTNANETREIGKIYMGEVFQSPTLLAPGGIKRKKADLSKTTRMDGGQTFSFLKPRYDTFTIRWAYRSSSFASKIAELQDNVGTGDNFFCILDEEDPDFSKLIYCSLDSMGAIEWAFTGMQGNLYGHEMTIEETL